MILVGRQEKDGHCSQRLDAIYPIYLKKAEIWRDGRQSRMEKRVWKTENRE
jgi:hypothetical protein